MYPADIFEDALRAACNGARNNPWAAREFTPDRKQNSCHFARLPSMTGEFMVKIRLSLHHDIPPSMLTVLELNMEVSL
ncbi:hypothetical protein [Litorivita sp. NS0012-18]|uniref:hypothetical protein n=1 Tax=Litorivita sp. NS0012-18 TaxID=3127655 RepID=UPI0033429EB8